MKTKHSDDDRDRIDLTAVDLTADPEAFDQFLRTVRRAAAAVLERRQRALGLGDLIVCWRRAILAGALVVSLASVALLWTGPEPDSVNGQTVAEALGIPQVWASWVYAGERPTPSDLLEFQGGTQ